MSLSSDVVSTGVKEAVGSSKITMRCGAASARAICASWRRAIESLETGAVTDASTPKTRIASSARRFIVRSSSVGPRLSSRPRNMFSAIERSGARMIS